MLSRRVVRLRVTHSHSMGSPCCVVPPLTHMVGARICFWWASAGRQTLFPGTAECFRRVLFRPRPSYGSALRRSGGHILRRDSRASQDQVTHGSPSISTDCLVESASLFARTVYALRHNNRRNRTDIGTRRIDEITTRCRRGTVRGQSPRRDPHPARAEGPSPGNATSEAYRESIRRTVEKRRKLRAGRGQGTGDSLPVGGIVPWPMPAALIIRHTPQVHDEIESFLVLLRK